jgi:hypothetical protein
MAALFFFASFPVFTRSLPAFVVALLSFLALFFFFLFSWIFTVERKKIVLKNPPPLVFSAVALSPSHQPQKERLWLTFIDLLHFVTLFRLPFHARSTSLPRSSSVPVLRWLVDAATPPLVHKKKLFIYFVHNAFFCSLGVFIVEPHTNALLLFAHFFRSMPKGICLKKEHRFFGMLPKKSSAWVKQISKWQR